MKKNIKRSNVYLIFKAICITSFLGVKAELIKIDRKRCKILHPNRGCAAISCRHLVPEWSPGGFDHRCEHCVALLLRSEKKSQSRKCCAKGKSVVLKTKYDILQNPPDLIKTVCDPRHKHGKEYLPHSTAYNNFMAYGSLSVGKERAPQGNFPVTKYNSDVHFGLSDLFAPDGKDPAFGQLFAVNPAESMQYRNTAINTIFTNLNPLLVKQLEAMFRNNNTLAKLYRKACEIYMQAQKEALAKGKEVIFYKNLLFF